MLMDEVGNTLGRETIKTKLMKFQYVSEGDKKGAEGAGTVSVYAMLPSMILSLVLSLVLYFHNSTNSNTPIEGMWAMVSVLQMMSYITLMNLHFPGNLLSFLEYIESVHDFNKWFPNPFTYLLPPSKLNMDPYNEQFENRGMENRNMIYLCGSDLIVMGFTALGILVLTPLSESIR